MDIERSEPELKQSRPRLDQKLQKKYDAARQDQREVITSLLDTLTKVDDFPEDHLEQVRDALFHANYPFLMVLVGPFSAGKSSIINALLGKEVLNVGPIPTTDHIHILRYGSEEQVSRVGETTTMFYPHELLESVSFVDTPGLESVFEKHDKITRSFLHRADLVLLVMVANHVLSSANMDVLKELKTFGKRVIIVVNQVDVLEEPERETVLNFVKEQSKLHLGFDPIIWMSSAKQALEAQQENPRDEILYNDSGFAEIEEYLIETLNDEVRIRQKLDTSLQIANLAREKALSLVAANQSALTEHQKTLSNIQAQVDESVRAQRNGLQTGLNEIDGLWAETMTRGSESIDELFGFSRAFGQAMSGILELTGLGAIIRRFGKRTRAEAAFDKHEVLKSLNKIPEAVTKLGARLEGRDLQDFDDLVTYTKGRIEQLPPNLKSKVIGQVSTPMNYDRSFIRRRQSELDALIQEASRLEVASLDRQLQNIIIALGLWEVVVIILAALVGLSAANQWDAGTVFIFLGVSFLMLFLGLLALPLRGWMINRAYHKRMSGLKDKHLGILREVLDEAVKYGAQVRQDTASPLTRLIEAQSRLTSELKTDLDTSGQGILRVQRGLGNL